MARWSPFRPGTARLAPQQQSRSRPKHSWLHMPSASRAFRRRQAPATQNEAAMPRMLATGSGWRPVLATWDRAPSSRPAHLQTAGSRTNPPTPRHRKLRAQAVRAADRGQRLSSRVIPVSKYRGTGPSALPGDSLHCWTEMNVAPLDSLFRSRRKAHPASAPRGNVSRS